MQMHASGASVRDIQTAIDRTYRPKYPQRTPTPPPPPAAPKAKPKK